MGTLSKMAEICQSCPDRDKCNHKRMEMCAYIETPKNVEGIAKGAGASAAAPLLRETMQINIGGGMAMIYKDEVERELERSHFQDRFLHYGAR